MSQPARTTPGTPHPPLPRTPLPTTRGTAPRTPVPPLPPLARTPPARTPAGRTPAARTPAARTPVGSTSTTRAAAPRATTGGVHVPRSAPTRRSGPVPSGPQLRLVPSPARTPGRAAARHRRRAPFVALLVGLLLATTLGLLALNTAIAVDSLQATQQRAANAQQAEAVSRLEQQVVAADTAAELARAATAAGLVQPGAPAHLVLQPDGTSVLLGTAVPAPDPNAPDPNAPAPAPAGGTPAAAAPPAATPPAAAPPPATGAPAPTGTTPAQAGTTTDPATPTPGN
ncbi:hypothetical protein [Modestobacter sp. SSW1-42]|uniref:hypothetical protein n=1 Tax=Modestobacter sp. SSW1-42 TaxID=596372 RepID=UPI00398617BB